ncbi:MAG: hypothetical protein JW769_03480 [Parachlamydiales bacterium]|nr:hypothetical protein [Parachlamydiales bacterium]
MLQKIEIWEQVIRCSPFWLIVDGVLVFHFGISWFFSWKKSGWVLDFWYFTLFYSFFIAVMMMYPFQASIYQKPAVGNDFFRVEVFMDQAFAITLLGYVFLWVGKYCYDFFSPRCVLEGVSLFFSPLQKIVEKNLRSSLVFYILLFFTFFFGGIIIFYQIKEDVLFSPRSFFLAQDALRPIYNLSLSIIALAITIAALRSIKAPKMKAGFLILFAFSFFWGLRGFVISALLTLMIYRSFAKQGKLKIARLVLSLLGMLFLALYIEDMRDGIYNPWHTIVSTIFRVIYGNHLSDTRDFAWVLSFWDGELLWGKTYISKIFSFIPRKFSQFRQIWDLSLVTAELVGLNPMSHAGLRIGWFGEAFLNFGYWGVSFVGLVAGYFLRQADDRIKKIITQGGDVLQAYAHTVTFIFISSLLLNASLWIFYVFLVGHILLYPFSKITILSDKALENSSKSF